MEKAITTIGIRLIALLALIALAGCGGERVGARGPEPSVQRGAAATPPPPTNMAGRWTLSSPGSSACAMTFGAPAGASEGTVAPEGGCPGNFFTTRKWSFEGGSLVLRDHNGQSLGQLTPAPTGHYEGQASGGMRVALSR